jgi:hypothetical protein
LLLRKRPVKPPQKNIFTKCSHVSIVVNILQFVNFSAHRADFEPSHFKHLAFFTRQREGSSGPPARPDSKSSKGSLIRRDGSASLSLLNMMNHSGRQVICNW